MAKVFLTPIDLSNLEIRNVLAQLLGSDPTGVEGKFYYHTGDHTIHFYNGSSWLILGRLDQISAPTADVSLNSHKITSLADGTASTDAVNKSQLDNAVAGIKWKASVRVATTVAGTLASSFENGDTIDGVTLATNDRILIKNQAAGEENGIYTVNASGAPTRGTDTDTAAEILQAAVFVEAGTTNADTGWVNTTNAPITLNTTPLVFAQFTGGTVTGGDGLTLTGSTLSVNVDTTTIEISGDTLRVVSTGLPIASGGTGSTTAAGAAGTLGFMRRYAASYGDNSATSFNIDHNLGTLDVHVQVYTVSTGIEVEVDVTRSTTNRVVLVHAVAPTTNQYRVVVVG